MPDEWEQDREPMSWRIRRWAAPAAMALAVAASIGAVQVLAGEHVSSATPDGQYRNPRFIITVGRSGDPSQQSGPAPWFQVHALKSGRHRLVDSVRPPSPSAGEAREILTGPDGTFVVASSRDRPCETRLHRFRLTDDGHVTGITPLNEAVVPARVAGLAMSPDGDRIAYTTAPCTDDAQPRATLTVLDIDSGDRRTWSTAAPSVIGEIVWADDNRTLGYTVSDIQQAPPSSSDTGNPRARMSSERRVGNVTVHALDTDEQGADLRTGRVLFRQPDASKTVTTAVMDSDGHAGSGVMKEGEPASTVLFTFAEGEPMRVTKRFAPKPGTVRLFAVSSGDDDPRYACLNGVDSFGRVVEGRLVNAPRSMHGCGSAFAY